MIISKKYGFIFFKPIQVGGSAIELALKPYLGANDILTPQTPYNPSADSIEYSHKGKNSWKWFLNPYFNHMNPRELHHVDNAKFNYFPKVTIVRNPIHATMSLFEWESSHNNQRLSPKPWELGVSNSIVWLAAHAKYRLQYSKLQRNLYSDLDKSRALLQEEIKEKNFFDFVEKIPSRWKQNEYIYFDREQVCADENYLRFENLQEDFIDFTKRFNIPYDSSTPLIHTKSQDSKPDDFLVHMCVEYVRNNPHVAIENGGRVSQQKLGRFLEGKIKRALNIILDDSKRIAQNFQYSSFSQARIEHIVRKYLNQFPDETY